MHHPERGRVFCLFALFFKIIFVFVFSGRREEMVREQLWGPEISRKRLKGYSGKRLKMRGDCLSWSKSPRRSSRRMFWETGEEQVESS